MTIGCGGPNVNKIGFESHNRCFESAPLSSDYSFVLNSKPSNFQTCSSYMKGHPKKI